MEIMEISLCWIILLRYLKINRRTFSNIVTVAGVSHSSIDTFISK